MARRSKSRSGRRSPKQNRSEAGEGIRPPGGPAENPAVEWLTVFWALALVTTMICELGSSAVNLALRRWPESPRLELLSAILLFAAMVIGTVALAALGLVLKFRRIRPTQGAIAFAVLVCGAPLVMVIYRYLAGPS